MRVRWIVPLVLSALFALATPPRANAAPESPNWYLDPVGGWVNFDDHLAYPDSFPLKDGFYGGGRIGRRFTPNFAIELAGGYSPAKRDDPSELEVTWMHASGNLVYIPATWSVGELFFSAGGGYVQRNNSDENDDLHYGTFEGAVGWKSWLSDHIGLRLEARNLLMIPHDNAAKADKHDLIYNAGLSFAFGGKPVDTDLDGVIDRKDKCPNTPAGATVDMTGCPKDSDGDGVLDGLDKCPDTPKGATVDASGCPADADNDGVLNGLDQCPDTPAGATVNAQGCPTDGDGDGVPDGIDKCPDTPKGATVDATGCPKDSDGDGVFDGLDKCPGTAAGLRVDIEGCPIEISEKETQLIDTGMIRLQNVNFETAKWEILAESYPVLDEVGQILLKYPEIQIEIGGHTDARGSVAYNQKLSENRAGAVRDYLAAKFPDLKAGQWSVKGYGEGKPIAPNNNALNMSKNRRVEFVVLNKEVLKREVERRRLLQK